MWVSTVNLVKVALLYSTQPMISFEEPVVTLGTYNVKTGWQLDRLRWGLYLM